MTNENKFIDLDIDIIDEKAQLFFYGEDIIINGTSNYNNIVLEEIEGVLEIESVDGYFDEEKIYFIKEDNYWIGKCKENITNQYNLKLIIKIKKGDYYKYKDIIFKLKQDKKDNISDFYINIKYITEEPFNGKYFEFNDQNLDYNEGIVKVKINTNIDLSNLNIQKISTSDFIKYKNIDLENNILIFEAEENKSIYSRSFIYLLEIEGREFRLYFYQTGIPTYFKYLNIDKTININHKKQKVILEFESNIDKLYLKNEKVLDSDYDIIERIEVYKDNKELYSIIDNFDQIYLELTSDNYLLKLIYYIKNYKSDIYNDVVYNKLTITNKYFNTIKDNVIVIKQNPKYFINFDKYHYECNEDGGEIIISGESNFKNICIKIQDNIISIKNIIYYIDDIEMESVRTSYDEFYIKNKQTGIYNFKIKLIVNQKDFYGYIEKIFKIYDFSNKDLKEEITIRQIGKTIQEFSKMFGFIKLNIHSAKFNYEEHEFSIEVITDTSWEVKIID